MTSAPQVSNHHHQDRTKKSNRSAHIGTLNVTIAKLAKDYRPDIWIRQLHVSSPSHEGSEQDNKQTEPRTKHLKRNCCRN